MFHIVDVDDGRLAVAPHPQLRYTLDELLAQCDATVEVSAEECAWLDDTPVGGALL